MSEYIIIGILIYTLALIIAVYLTINIISNANNGKKNESNYDSIEIDSSDIFSFDDIHFEKKQSESKTRKNNTNLDTHLPKNFSKKDIASNEDTITFLQPTAPITKKLQGIYDMIANTVMHNKTIFN